MPSVDFETATKQEEARLQKLHPTSEDIPGCLKLFDTFLSCNGTTNPTCFLCLQLIDIICQS
jgi:hypothetical protein